MERETAERFRTARTTAEVGEIVGDACRSEVPFGGYGFVVAEPRVTDRPTMIVRSNEFPTDWCISRFQGILLAIEKDLGGLMSALRVPHAYDGFERFPRESLKDTELLNDHWRPLRCDQQLVAPIWLEGEPAGYFSVIRSRREARFSAADLLTVEDLRVRAERAISSLGNLGMTDLHVTIDALSQAFPWPAFLFDDRGDMVWMSDEGAVRLSVASARLGSGRLVRSSPALDGLSRHARAVLGDPAVDGEGTLRREGVLRQGERLAMRHFGECTRKLLLLAITPAMAGLPGTSRGEETGTLPNLGAVESKVARLAAEGFTVLNIATQLDVSEATVRTHLHRVYVKLGVHGRAELATLLSLGRA